MNQTTHRTIIIVALCISAFTFFTNPPSTYAQQGPFNRIGQLDGLGHIRDIVVAGDTAYFVTEENGLTVVDVSNPRTPIVITSFTIEGGAYAASIIENVAYVMTDSGTLMIVDVSDPTSPVLFTSLEVTGNLPDIDVVDHVAYVSSFRSQSLKAVDVSDPMNPVLLDSVEGVRRHVRQSGGAIQTADPLLLSDTKLPGYSQNLQVSGNVAYIADWDALVMIDVSDPTSLRFINATRTSVQSIQPLGADRPHEISGTLVDVDVVGDIIYIADEYNLVIMDVSDPTSPVLLNSFASGDVELPDGFSSYGPRSVEVVGNKAYLAVLEGLMSVDVSNPNAPTFIEFAETPRTVSYTQMVGDVIYVVSRSFDEVYLYEEALPLAVTLSPPAVMPLSAATVTVITILFTLGTLITHLLARKKKSMNQSTHRVIIIITFCLSVLTLLTYNPLSSHAQPTTFNLISTVDGFGEVNDVAVAGDTAYFATRDDGLVIVDVSDPRSPIIVDSFMVDGWIYSITVVEDVAYIVTGVASSELMMLDVSTPTSPTLLGSLDTDFHSSGLYVSNGVAYLSNFRSESLKTVDVSDPTAPVLLADVRNGEQHGRRSLGQPTELSSSINSTKLPNFSQKIQVSGNTAYIADWNTLVMFDVTDPTAPVFIDSIETSEGYGTVLGIQAVGEVLYVADKAHLVIMDISDPASPVLLNAFYSYADELGSSGSFSPRSVEIIGNKAYMSTYFGIISIDVSNPSAPVVLDYMNTPTVVHFTQVIGDVIYAFSGGDGFNESIDQMHLLEEVGAPLAVTLSPPAVMPLSAATVTVMSTMIMTFMTVIFVFCIRTRRKLLL